MFSRKNARCVQVTFTNFIIGEVSYLVEHWIGEYGSLIINKYAVHVYAISDKAQIFKRSYNLSNERFTLYFRLRKN